MILAGGKIILAGLVTTRQSHLVQAREFLNNGMRGVYSLGLPTPDDQARPCRPKAGYGLVTIMMMTMMMTADDCRSPSSRSRQSSRLPPTPLPLALQTEDEDCGDQHFSSNVGSKIIKLPT